MRLQKFDETIKKIYLWIRLNKIQKNLELKLVGIKIKKGLKFLINDQNKQISRQNKTITEIVSQIKELKINL